MNQIPSHPSASSHRRPQAVPGTPAHHHSCAGLPNTAQRGENRLAIDHELAQAFSSESHEAGVLRLTLLYFRRSCSRFKIRSTGAL